MKLTLTPLSLSGLYAQGSNGCFTAEENSSELYIESLNRTIDLGSEILDICAIPDFGQVNLEYVAVATKAGLVSVEVETCTVYNIAPDIPEGMVATDWNQIATWSGSCFRIHEVNYHGNEDDLRATMDILTPIVDVASAYYNNVPHLVLAGKGELLRINLSDNMSSGHAMGKTRCVGLQSDGRNIYASTDNGGIIAYIINDNDDMIETGRFLHRQGECIGVIPFKNTEVVICHAGDKLIAECGRGNDKWEVEIEDNFHIDKVESLDGAQVILTLTNGHKYLLSLQGK